MFGAEILGVTTAMSGLRADDDSAVPVVTGGSWTPGPWRVGTKINVRTAWPDGIFTGPQNYDAICVAHVSGLPLNHSLEELASMPEYAGILANAKLISLAPELAEALRNLLTDEGEHNVGCKEYPPGHDDSKCCPVHIARAVLAKLK